LINDHLSAFIAVMEFISYLFDNFIDFFINLFQSIANKIGSIKKLKIIKKVDEGGFTLKKEREQPIESNDFINSPNDSNSNSYYPIKYLIITIISGVIIYSIYTYFNNDSNNLDGNSFKPTTGYISNYYETIKD